MNIIHYVRRRGRLEYEQIHESIGEKSTELRFSEELEGSIKLGGFLKKISGKACIFDTGSLKDGFYFPTLYLKGSVIELEGFEIRGARLRPIPKNDAYVRRLSSEIEAIRRELSDIREALSSHDEKINGHPIF